MITNTSQHSYSKEYLGPKFILDQIEIVEKQWNLDGSYARSFVSKIKKLPQAAEGFFAIPKVSAVIQNSSVKTMSMNEQYCEAVKLTFALLDRTRIFTRHRHVQITPEQIHQRDHTIKCLSLLENQQEGDILIIAAQYGMRHRGRSIRQTRVNFMSNEFGLGLFQVACMTLVHPERHTHSSELAINCAGDEFSPHKNMFVRVPSFYFSHGYLRLGMHGISLKDNLFGSVSGFLF